MVEMSEPKAPKSQELATLEGLIGEAQGRLDALQEEERMASRAAKAARQVAGEIIRKANAEIRRREERLAKDRERLATDREAAQRAPALGSAFKPAERAAFVSGYYLVFDDLGWNVADLRCRCGKLEREHFGGALGECSGFRVARRIG